MKIAMIGHKYVPSREGGVEIVVEELSKRLSALGNEVTIFNRRRKEYTKISEFEGCKVEEVFTINKKSLDAIVYAFFATLKVRKLIKRKKVDAVHFHCEGPCFFLNLLPKNKKKYPTKVVVTIHGLDWQRGKWGGFATKILKHGEKQAVKYSDEMIVLSNNVKKYFKDTYNRETTFIPNGIELPTLKESLILFDKYGLKKDDYILFLARVVPEKGLDYLIDAWKQLSDKQKNNKKLVIAGGESHTTDYYNSILNKCKEDKSIILTGFVSGRELEELYSNAYLYILPSDIEGMPMSLLEALAYGNRCLVSNIEENTSVITKDDYVFEKSDTNDLKEKIINIISLNLKTHDHQVQVYKWSDVVKETIKVYERNTKQNG